MNNLSYFLMENAEKVQNKRLVASTRFKDENSNPVEWEIRAITGSEDEELRRASIIKGRNSLEIDVNQYIAKLAAKCTVYPNLNDAELQDSYHVLGAEALIKAMLTPGEYAAFISEIQEINGFNSTFDDKVKQAKN